MKNYDDIINMEHHVSKTHPRMSMENRAAQFAPFSALKGYNESIKETSRITESKKELDDYIKLELSDKINNLKNNDLVEIKYFEKDKTKIGGKYIIIKNNIKKTDKFNKIIYLKDNKKILIDDIIELQKKENNV